MAQFYRSVKKVIQSQALKLHPGLSYVVVFELWHLSQTSLPRRHLGVEKATTTEGPLIGSRCWNCGRESRPISVSFCLPIICSILSVPDYPQTVHQTRQCDPIVQKTTFFLEKYSKLLQPELLHFPRKVNPVVYLLEFRPRSKCTGNLVAEVSSGRRI